MGIDPFSYPGTLNPEQTPPLRRPGISGSFSAVSKEAIVEANLDPEQQDAAPELVVRAEALVRKFPECFWYWHPSAGIKTIGDVRLVAENLRRYGRKPAWHESQELRQCL